MLRTATYRLRLLVLVVAEVFFGGEDLLAVAPGGGVSESVQYDHRSPITVVLHSKPCGLSQPVEKRSGKNSKAGKERVILRIFYWSLRTISIISNATAARRLLTSSGVAKSWAYPLRAEVGRNFELFTSAQESRVLCPLTNLFILHTPICTNSTTNETKQLCGSLEEEDDEGTASTCFQLY